MANSSQSVGALLQRVKAYPEPSKPRITTDVVGLLQQINSLQAQVAEFGMVIHLHATLIDCI
jgi:hypothetical protein